MFTELYCQKLISDSQKLVSDKTEVEAGGVTQAKSSYLASVRPWVQTPVLPKKKK
jgi:hypothetical protein